MAAFVSKIVKTFYCCIKELVKDKSSCCLFELHDTASKEHFCFMSIKLIDNYDLEDNVGLQLAPKIKLMLSFNY